MAERRRGDLRDFPTTTSEGGAEAHAVKGKFPNSTRLFGPANKTMIIAWQLLIHRNTERSETALIIV